MPDARYRNCRGCGKSSDVVGLLSWTRLCASCSRERLETNIDQLVAHSGPQFQAWRRGMVAACGGVLLDDLPPPMHTPD